MRDGLPQNQGFIGRWSRLKQRAGSGQLGDAADSFENPSRLGTESDVEDPNRLDFSADFSKFLQPEVDDQTHRSALRRLWLSSPLFSASDHLDVYWADYTQTAIDKPMVAENAAPPPAAQKT